MRCGTRDTTETTHVDLLCIICEGLESRVRWGPVDAGSQGRDNDDADREGLRAPARRLTHRLNAYEHCPKTLGALHFRRLTPSS